MKQTAHSRTLVATSQAIPGYIFKTRHCFFKIWMFALLWLATTTSHADTAEDISLQPSPSLTPRQVVTFQLNALRQASDAGISATFRFASPENRRVTGPVEHFARLFDSAQYQPMLNNRGTEVKLVSNDGFNAKLLAGVVDQSGELHWYSFRLSRQSEPPYENCWMTDAVLAVPHPGDSA